MSARLDQWLSAPAIPQVRTGRRADLRVEAARTRGEWRHLWRAPILWVTVLAACLRLWGLSGAPVVYFDSGVYLGEGRFLASAAQRATNALLAPPTDPGASPLDRVARAVEVGTDAHPPDIAKPGQALLLAVAMLLLGPSAFAGSLVSALAGIATVAATYSLARLGWGRGVAISAALLLTVSGEHLVYSREPLVESDGLALATLATLVYLRACLRGNVGPPRLSEEALRAHGDRSSSRTLFLVGLLYGVSFSCNNRLTYMPLALAVTELALWRPRRLADLRPIVARAVPVAVGFVLPLAAIEGGYLVARLIARATDTPAGFLDYAQQLAAFSRMNAPRIRLDEWPTYFADIGLMEGLPVLVLFVIGLLVALWRRRLPDLTLLAWTLIPLAFYSVYSTGEVRMRHFSLMLPWLAIAASLGVWHLARLIIRSHASLAAAAATLALVGLSAPRVLDIVTVPNGMPALTAYLAANNVQRLATTNGPVLSFYVGEANTNARLRPAFINTPDDLAAMTAQYPYLSVDMQAYLYPSGLTDEYDAGTPVLDVANGNDAWYLADLLDTHGVTWLGWTDLLRTWQTHAPSATRLRLFASSALGQQR